MQLARYLLGVTVAALALPAQPIQVRPDRDDAEYLELATRYPSAVALPEGEGVLIAARWVLTSAARAKALRDAKPMPRLLLGEEAHEIQSVTVGDVGLVFLRKGVPDIEPSRLYRGDDEAGKTVAIAGHGNADRKKRASINTIDRVEARTLGLRVKPLDDASDLQGRAVAGDIGAPLFIEAPAGIQVAGILASIDGDWETYARVSVLAPWIEAVMLDATKREMESLMDPDRR